MKRVMGMMLLALIGVVGGCSKSSREVVVYTALDQNFSEPIFKMFTDRTGVRVLPKYDVESTKTVGLVNAIVAEAAHPRCDVFWNNEIVNTIRLKKLNLLAPCEPANAALYPEQFQDADRCWFGFAARARVIVVNTNLVPADAWPRQIRDLANPELRKLAGIAKPLFGTTASHVACLFSILGPESAKELLLSLKANGISVESGNKACALAVANGRLAAALTDTDDAIIELRSGAPVTVIFPDQQADGMGTLLLPNTLALIKGCPHPQAAQELIDFLLSPEVEAMLAQAESAQIPLNSQAKGPHPIDPLPARWMKVDFGQAADAFDEAALWVRDTFLNPE